MECVFVCGKIMEVIDTSFALWKNADLPYGGSQDGATFKKVTLLISPGGGLIGQDQTNRLTPQPVRAQDECIAGPLTPQQKWLVCMRCQTWWDDTFLNCKKEKSFSFPSQRVSKWGCSVNQQSRNNWDSLLICHPGRLINCVLLASSGGSLVKTGFPL